MSPEARGPGNPAPGGSPGVDALVGALLALPVGVVLSQIPSASYRSGAAAVALVVVVGLASRWSVACGVAPVLWLAQVFQTTDDLARAPAARDVAGLAVAAVSFAVVVAALRRWEGDRRRARDEAAARLRNERRLHALVDLAHHLAGVGDRGELAATIGTAVPRAAGASGAILVVDAGDRVEYPIVTGEHDPRWIPAPTPAAELLGTPATEVLRTGAPVFCATRAELLARYESLADYVHRSGQSAWAALPIPGVGVLVLSWREEQVFSAAQRAFLETIANLLVAAADRIAAVEQAQLGRFVAAFDAMVDGVGIHRAVRDANGRVDDFEVEYLNPASVLPGRRRTDLIGRRMSELWRSSPTLAHYVHVVETGEPFLLEDADMASLGGPYAEVETVSIRASRLDEDRIVLVVRDVSERTRLVREIRDANAMLSVAQELARVGSWRYDLATDDLEWSPELYRIVGVPEGAPPVRPTGDSLFGVEHPDDRGIIVHAVRKALRDGGTFTVEMRIVRQDDGSLRDVVTTGTVVTTDGGEVVRIWGATQDVTERRRAESLRRAALDALEHEREAVAALQRVILPSALPEVDGVALHAQYRAASAPRTVGGDWYDAFVAPDGRLMLVIGDVAGHGIDCAALANELRVSVRVRVHDGMGPGEIVGLLDAEVGDDFATCWIGAYDPRTRRLTYANAGHLPVVVARDGEARPVGGRTAPPLGSARAAYGAEAQIGLLAGDLVVLCTDGLVERRGESIDAGLDRLCRSAKALTGAGSPARGLVEELAADADDDVCVLTMRID